MKRFKNLTEVPRDCIVAPSIFFAPRPGSKPIGSFSGTKFFDRRDVSELRTIGDWKRDGRKIKAREKPLAQRGSTDPEGIYAIWQTE